MKLPSFLSNINWDRIGRLFVFYVQAILIILARIIYLFVYEVLRFIKKFVVFLYTQVKLVIAETKRRRVFPRIKKALHFTAVVTWFLSKKLTKTLIKNTQKFIVFIAPYIKRYSKLLVRYVRRAGKRITIVATYILIRFEKTSIYKKARVSTQKYVVKPLLATAISKKPYAIALMVMLFVTSSFVFLNDQRAIEAATNTWTQTDWSGGQGSSTSNQYTSVSGLATNTSLSLAPGAWLYKKTITIDSDQVSGSSDLTNFPFLYSVTDTDLRSTANGGSVAQSDGGDIKFVASDGTTQLDHEIEEYDPATGKLIVWVRIPTLSYNSDTVFYILYGNEAGSLDESNAAGVWPTDEYVGVYHLNEDATAGQTTSTHFDSTPNSNDGAQRKNNDTLGKIGTGQQTDTYADHIDFNTINDELNEPLDEATISMWVRKDVDQSSAVAFAAGTNGADRIWFYNVGTTWQMTRSAAGGASKAVTFSESETPLSEWVHMTMTWDIGGDVQRAFVNGVEKGTAQTGIDSFGGTFSTNGNVQVGGFTGANFYGAYDELRIHRSVRSSDWLTTEYNNQNDPSSFYSTGSQLDDVSPSGNLISASFDTGEPSSLIGSIAWGETLPVNTDIEFQLRTSPDNTTWTDWLGPTGTGDYYTDATGGEVINAVHTDGVDDQYIQYKVFLSNTDNASTPTLSDVTITYVANGAPEFNTDYPIVAAGGAGATVSTDGTSTVTINYSVRDADTSSGSVTPGFVTPSFEYSLNGGSTWSSIATSTLALGDWDDKVVDETTYNVYSATWDAEASVGNSVYVTNAQIRTTVDDNEGGNNIATSTTANFTLDTTNPSVGVTPMTVDASVSPAAVTLSCSDDTALEQKIGLANDLSDASYVSYTGTTTLAGVGVPVDVVYGQCRDAYGNETAVQSVTTPTQPTNMYYQDISNVSEGDYSLFVSWSAVPEPSAGFASYRLYRSIDGSNYSPYQTITNRTTNYYIDTGLSTGTTYYYKLYVLDDDGNKSAYSAVVSDNPDGSGGTDNTSPTISSVSATSTPQEATITWTTDELSNSTVYYSATTSDPGTDPASYALSQGVGSFVTNHSVAISGLMPGTQYYYLVRSTDAQNNIGTDSSSGVFTTGAGVSISAVSASQVFNEEVTITWNTDAPSDSTVYYSVNSDMSSAQSINSATEVVGHSVVVEGLTGGTKYYFYVESGTGGDITQDKNVVDGVTEYYTFTTTSDSIAPTVASVTNALIGETGVTIAWSTNEGATSQVIWGPASNNLNTTTTETSIYTTQHAVTLTGLDTTTTYYYKVKSVDRAGNTTLNDDGGSPYQVTTNAPGGGGGGVVIIKARDSSSPNFSEIDDSVSASQATLTFTTDEPSGILFQYGITSIEENQRDNRSMYQTSHGFTVGGLVSNERYSYKITAIDIAGNQTVREGVFRTLEGDGSEDNLVNLDDLNNDNQNQEKEVAEESDQPVETVENPEDLASLTKNASAVTVREVLESVFANSNLFNIPSDFLLASASKLAENFDHSVVSNEDLKKADNEFLFENLRVAGVTGQGATVVWKTTVPTKSLIYLTDLRSGETRELKDSSFLLSHEYSINRLEPSASYSIQVIAENEFGERLGSQALSFSTFVDKSEPLISDLKTSTSILPGKENKVQAIISWKTNKPTTARVLYEAGVGDGDDFAFSSVNNQSYTFEHVVVVSGLQSGQVYRMRVESVDGQGKAVYSSDRTLITPRSKESIVDVIIENFEQTFGFLR